mgnify:CR=1 FL=1
MAGFLIALLSGALMSVQGVFNTQVTKTTGVWVSNGWVQLSAFLLCLFGWQQEETLLQHLWKSSRVICCWEV